MKTAVQREVEWQIYTDLLELPCAQRDRESTDDALADALLRHPETLEPLRHETNTSLGGRFQEWLVADESGETFPIEDGIPVMLESEARQLEPDILLPSRIVLCGTCDQLLRASNTPRVMSLRQRSSTNYDSGVLLTATLLLPGQTVFSVDRLRTSTPVSTPLV